MTEVFLKNSPNPILKNTHEKFIIGDFNDWKKEKKDNNNNDVWWKKGQLSFILFLMILRFCFFSATFISRWRKQYSMFDF